jgi:hypothetical protein
MPVSDIIFTIFGAMSYASIFGVIVWTGYRTRREESVKKKSEAAGADKNPPGPAADVKQPR